MVAGPKERRAAAFKVEKLERTVAQVRQAPAQTPQLPPPLQQARHLHCRQVNTLGEDGNESEEGEEEAQRARQLERDLADQVATRTAERQRMEDKL